MVRGRASLFRLIASARGVRAPPALTSVRASALSVGDAPRRCREPAHRGSVRSAKEPEIQLVAADDRAQLRPVGRVDCSPDEFGHGQTGPRCFFKQQLMLPIGQRDLRLPAHAMSVYTAITPARETSWSGSVSTFAPRLRRGARRRSRPSSESSSPRRREAQGGGTSTLVRDPRRPGRRASSHL
jgi:hypothetical protein